MESSRDFDFEFSRGLTLDSSRSSFCGDQRKASLKKKKELLQDFEQVTRNRCLHEVSLYDRA